MWWNVGSAECSQKEKKFLGSDFVKEALLALLYPGFLSVTCVTI